MIENESQLLKEAIKTGIFGCLVMIILSLVLKNMSYLLGYVLGLVCSLVIYKIDCYIIGFLIDARLSKLNLIQVFYFLIKMGIYALGFLLAVLIPTIFNIFCVAIGYISVKLTIYRLAMTRR